MQKFENKPFIGQSSYYLIQCKITHSYGMNLPNSQSPTSEILSIPFIEEDTLNPTHLHTAEDQINYFIASNTEPQYSGFSNTVNLNNSAYSNARYNKIKKLKTFYCRTLNPKYVTLY